MIDFVEEKSNPMSAMSMKKKEVGGNTTKGEKARTMEVLVGKVINAFRGGGKTLGQIRKGRQTPRG